MTGTEYVATAMLTVEVIDDDPDTAEQFVERILTEQLSGTDYDGLRAIHLDRISVWEDGRFPRASAVTIDEAGPGGDSE